MTPQMMSFPNFIREAEQTTRPLDHAFPPLKVEHKYKSVYERAGFDVNKGDNSHRNQSDNKSIGSGMKKRNFSNPRIQHGSTNNSSSSLPQVNTRKAPIPPPQLKTDSSDRVVSPTSSSSSKSSKSLSMNSNFTGTHKSNSSHTTLRNTAEFNGAFEQPLTTGSSTTTFFGENDVQPKPSNGNPMSTVDVGLTAANTNVPTKPHFDNKSMHEHHQIGSNVLSENKNASITTRNEDNSPNRPAFDAHNDQFDFSPSPSQSGKNLKNLKLELNHDNLSDTSSLPDVNQNQKFESSNNPYQSRNSSSDDPAKDIYAQQGYQTQSQSNSQPGSANSGVRFDPRRQRHQPASATSSKFPAQNSPQYPVVHPQQRGPAPYPASPMGTPGHGSQYPPPPPPSQQQQRNMSPTSGHSQQRIVSPVSMHSQQRHMSPTGMHHHQQMQNQRPNQPPVPRMGGMHPNPKQPQLPLMTLGGQKQPYYPQSPGAPPLRLQNRPYPQPQGNVHGHPPAHQLGMQQQQQGYPRPQGPPQQTRQRQQTYSQIRDDKLSSALNEFKSDYESHKGSNDSPTTSNTETDLPSSSSSDLDLYKSTPAKDSLNNTPEINDYRFSYEATKQQQQHQVKPVAATTATNDPSVQFQNFTTQQLAKEGDLNTEYQQFLNQKEIGKRDNYDNRHLSMVSSIISKESNNSNEDEIEKELERQLEKLKMSGSSINLSKVESQGGNGSNAGTDYATPDTTMIIPKFNIQDVDDDPEPQLENVQNELELEEETTRPLTITRTNSTYEDEVAPAQVEEPIAKSVKFTELQPEAKITSNVPQPQPGYPINDSFGIDDDDDNDNGDDEYVKPLSPKNHLIEQELQSMNFQISQTTESPTTLINQTFESTTIATKDPLPSGTGPCRSCHESISPDAKGQLRAIYSKTGELSGQWHRKCFQCCYHEGDATDGIKCNIQFNKHVQCYVFDDQPYCFQHYHILNNSICQHCEDGIEGECIENELMEKWHLQCLKCSNCHMGIRQDYYIVNEHDIICHECKTNNNMGLNVQDRIEKRRTRIYNNV